MCTYEANDSFALIPEKEDPRTKGNSSAGIINMRNVDLFKGQYKIIHFVETEDKYKHMLIGIGISSLLSRTFHT